MSRSRTRKRRSRASRKGRTPDLSLCMIARDEEEFLDACLRSVRGLVDEIVVVDTGSRDGTAGMAREHGAVVLTQAWSGDFSAARNLSVRAAHGRWILVLDCDEVLARSDHDGIRAAMTGGEAEAFRLTTRNYTRQDNRAGFVACEGAYPEEKDYPGWFPTTKVRLWLRRPQVVFQGPVHELVEPSLIRLGVRIADCPVPVHHYGYAEKERSSVRYLEAGERKVRENPHDLRARFELCLAYRNAGRLAEALELADGVLEQLDQAPAQRRVYVQEEMLLLARADILDRLGRTEEALAAYKRIRARYPRSHAACNNMGIVLERRGELDAARRLYAEGARLAPDNRLLAENLARVQESLTRMRKAPAERAGCDVAASPAAPIRLSVCLIARNEEAVLRRCLESVQEVADEIVLVDTGSSDATREIASEYGARVESFEWCEDFAAARNASVELARGTWVLWLDADEVLPPDARQRLVELKTGPPDRGYFLQLVNQGADRSRFRQLKLFPRRPDIRFERPVHETVLPSLRRAALAVEDADVEVHHTGYADPDATRRKTAYYLQILERWLEDHPDDAAMRFRAAHSHYILGNHQAAQRGFGELLEDPWRNVDSVTRRRALTFVGRCLLEQARYAEAVPPLEMAVEAAPQDMLALTSLGDAYTKLKRYDRALPVLRRALDGVPDADFPLDASVLRYSALFFLGQVHQALGETERARQALERARDELPERAEAGAALSQLGGISGAGVPLHTVPREPVSDEGDSSPRGTLSLCMIVRDEEERLGRCLDSVAGLPDEIVVVDTGSRDGTRELARSRGARVGEFEWCDDFAAARNAALQMATGDWILWLDADDVLPREEHDRIRRLLGSPPRKAFFFVLDDRGYERVSCLQMRLFPHLPGVEFELPIHEQVTPSLARLGIEMVSTDIRVVHTGYTSPAVVREKKDRYLRIMERWLEQHPEDYIVRSHVALTYHTTGRLAEALEAYRKILYESRCREDHNYVVYTTALLFLGRTYLKLGDLDQALSFLHQAEEMDRDYVLTQVSLAEVLVRRGEYAEALSSARAALAGGQQVTFFPFDPQEVEYSARILEGKAYQGQGRMELAEQAFRRALKVPVARRSEALGSLSELYRAHGDLSRAREALEEARRMDPENLQHLFNLGITALDQRAWEDARGCFEAVLERDPGRTEALLNLGYIAKVQGDVDRAESLYREAISHDHQGVEARANLAHLLLEQERYAEAGPLFEEADRRRPGLLDVELGRAVALAQGGSLESIRPLLKGVFARFPSLPAHLHGAEETADSLLGLAAELIRRDMLKCAGLALQAGSLLDPSRAEIHAALGDLYLREGALWRAVGEFEALLKLKPADAEGFRHLGEAYERLGVERAAALCRRRAEFLEETVG